MCKKNIMVLFGNIILLNYITTISNVVVKDFFTDIIMKGQL